VKRKAEWSDTQDLNPGSSFTEFLGKLFYLWASVSYP
jgi:hypothetical protein